MKEGDLSAQQHFACLCETLSMYEKTIYSVICLSGDNVSVNKCLADLCSVPLMDCNRYKLNLAIEGWIKMQLVISAVLKKVRDLMYQLRTLKNASQLSNLTHISAVLPNSTRSTGTLDMLERIFQIETHVTNILELNLYLPISELRRTLINVVEHFQRPKRMQCFSENKGWI